MQIEEVEFNSGLKSVSETGVTQLLFRNSSYWQGISSLSLSCHYSLAPLLRLHGRVLSVLTFPTVRVFALENPSCVSRPNQSLICSDTTKARRICPVVSSFSDLFYLHSSPVEYAL